MADLSKWNKPHSNATSMAGFGLFKTERKDPNASLNTAIEALSSYSASKIQASPKVTINIAGNVNKAQLKQMLSTLEKPFHPQLAEAPTPKTNLPRLGSGG